MLPNTTQKKGKTYDLLLKIVLVGNSGCGKTSVFDYFVADEKCRALYRQTIGVDFRSKNVQVQGKIFQLHLWDTSGKDKSKNVIENFFKGAVIAIFMFDITDRYSFDNVRKWLELAQENIKKQAVRCLVGTKCDLFEKREVDRHVAEEEAKELGMKYFQCSSVTGENIKEIFNSVARDFYDSDIMKQQRNKKMESASLEESNAKSKEEDNIETQRQINRHFFAL